MDTFPTVNLTDFHMQNYPSTMYAQIEQFCAENEFTVDYFLEEFAVNEEQIRKPFSVWRGRSPISER